jgi:NAD(P)-dependent dehydrogenase (short-subunit alcohol dehydrogenase family)
MEQKIALVTGGSSGLGFAIAKKFAANDIYTFIIGRDQEKLDKACKEICKNVQAISFDITELHAIPEMVKSIVEQKGKIDILVNNAGINLKKYITEVTDEEFQSILHTNTTSVFALSREVAKVMLSQKSGSIINISSMAAYYGIPSVVPYSASKAAIEGMTRAMAVDLSPKGIRVNCIAPGFIATPMSATALDNDPDRKNKVLSRTPLGRLGKSEDIANTAYFLASDEACFITGTSIPVDGGNSIGF